MLTLNFKLKSQINKNRNRKQFKNKIKIYNVIRSFKINWNKINKAQKNKLQMFINNYENKFFYLIDTY